MVKRFFIDGAWLQDFVRIAVISIDSEVIESVFGKVKATLANQSDQVGNGDLLFYSDEHPASIKIDGANSLRFFNLIGLNYANFSQETIRDLYLRRHRPRLEHKM